MVIPFDNRAVEITVRILAERGVVIIPCDTIYGLCGVVEHTTSRIVEIKGRSEEKKLITLAADRKSAESLTANGIDDRISRFWPAPLTIIARQKDDETVAIRVPDNTFLHAVLCGAGPIYSTSVNRSGEPFMENIEEIIDRYGDVVELIVDAGNLEAGQPSTILDTTRTPYRILREGSFEFPRSMYDTRLIETL